MVRGNSGNGRVIAYDKQQRIGQSDPSDEVRSLAKDRLRVEVRLRPRALKAQGIVTVGDITPAKVYQAHRKWFDYAGFDLEVISLEGLRTRLASLANRLPRDAAKVVGKAYLESMGLDTPGAPATLARLRRIEKDEGLVAAMLLPTSEQTAHLDYDAGVLVHH